MTIPHIKVTDTMLNKYTIDAKKDVLEQFDIDPQGEVDWLEPTYVLADFHQLAYGSYNITTVQIKFYKTARGDKRMSIPKLRKYAEVGDYVWFEIIPIRDSVHHFRINISKELPLDEERYEQLQVRYG